MPNGKTPSTTSKGQKGQKDDPYSKGARFAEGRAQATGGSGSIPQ